MTDILSSADRQTVEGPGEYFTGRATIKGQFARQDPSRVTGAIVSFEPGARTVWHTHPLGQTLIVLDGTGWTRTENGCKQTFTAGDIVLCPADTHHWHGTTPDGPMAHAAIQEAIDGTNVTWIEPVTDDEDLAGPG